MKQGKNPNWWETTALGNRPRQQPPEGETRCRTRPTLQNTNNQVRPRREDHDQSTNHRNRRKLTQHHHPSGQRGIRELCRQGLRRSKWNPNTAKRDTKTGPDRGWERSHRQASNPQRPSPPHNQSSRGRHPATLHHNRKCVNHPRTPMAQAP